MTAPCRTVTYGLDADAYLVAHAVDSALEGAGYHVSVGRAKVEQAEAEDEVWICRRNGPLTDGVQFRPGQQLVVTYDEGWRIEPAPVIAA